MLARCGLGRLDLAVLVGCDICGPAVQRVLCLPALRCCSAVASAGMVMLLVMSRPAWMIQTKCCSLQDPHSTAHGRNGRVHTGVLLHG